MKRRNGDRKEVGAVKLEGVVKLGVAVLTVEKSML